MLALPDATGIRDQATGAETTEVTLDPGVGTPTRTLKHATRATERRRREGTILILVVDALEPFSLGARKAKSSRHTRGGGRRT